MSWTMKIKAMGRTGLKVSEICLGTMTFGNQADEATAFAIMDKADQAGVTKGCVKPRASALGI